MLYNFIRKLLFKLPPETAHTLTLTLLDVLPGFLFSKPKKLTSKNIMGIQFPNSVGVAAGLDKNGDHVLALSKLGFGFIEIGTVTPKPQPGNPKPRLFRIPEADALINRMGFNNKGVDYLIEQVKKSRFKGVLGINIGKNFNTDIKNAVEDYLICFRKVYPYASYVTINISSPNTTGLRDLQHAEYLANLLAKLKQEQTTQKQRFSKYVPLVLKIAPDLTAEEIKDIAELVLQYKIDGVIATNTTIDKLSVAQYQYGDEQGGLSGKPLTQKSTEVIKQLHFILGDQTPIIAAGGIMSADDALEKLSAGASLVQIYTGLIYQGPTLIKKILHKT